MVHLTAWRWIPGVSPGWYPLWSVSTTDWIPLGFLHRSVCLTRHARSDGYIVYSMSDPAEPTTQHIKPSPNMVPLNLQHQLCPAFTFVIASILTSSLISHDQDGPLLVDTCVSIPNFMLGISPFCPLYWLAHGAALHLYRCQAIFWLGHLHHHILSYHIRARHRSAQS